MPIETVHKKIGDASSATLRAPVVVVSSLTPKVGDAAVSMPTVLLSAAVVVPS